MALTMTPFKNESLMNFALPEHRDAMAKAIEKVRSQLGRSYGLHSGEVRTDRATRTIASINPSQPDQVVGVVTSSSKEEALQALTTVSKGSAAWKRTPAAKRIELTDKLADWMVERKFELAAWMVFEVGKTWREADADVCEAIDFCRYYAREMNRLSEPLLTQLVQGEHDVLTYHPKGVALVIAPWNFPFAILAGMTIASLVTGNTVVFKPAEQSSIIAAMLAQGLKAVGFPDDSYYFLTGVGEDIGPLLIHDPRVDLIVFTGSAEVGFSIIESASKRPQAGQRGIKKVIAELGGKNALIIDDDADLDEAVAAAVHSAFGYQGQKCSALSRLIVHEKVFDTFLPRFVEATRSLRIGDPTKPEYQVGPVIDETSRNRILKTIEQGKKSLKLLYSATDVPSKGYYVPPTIFEVEDISSDLFQKEIFGPVVVAKRARDLEDAVKLANSVPYALTGGVFSRSPKHIDYVKAEMEVGNLYINRAITGATVQRHPFGGFKMSGIGSKAGGPDYLLQFLEPRTCAENTVRRGFAGE